MDQIKDVSHGAVIQYAAGVHAAYQKCRLPAHGGWIGRIAVILAIFDGAG
jgi:hypothetical protein